MLISLRLFCIFDSSQSGDIAVSLAALLEMTIVIQGTEQKSLHRRDAIWEDVCGAKHGSCVNSHSFREGSIKKTTLVNVFVSRIRVRRIGRAREP